VIKEIKEIAAVGHRVVHGGEEFHQSVLIDDHVLEIIRKVQDLAPLHNPPNIAGIEAAKNRLAVAVPVALLLIFILLYFTFHSVKQGTDS
jgi:acetate kinase